MKRMLAVVAGLAGLLGFTACASAPMKYVPSAPISTAPPSSNRAAVSAVVDETRETTSDDERASGHQMYDFAKGGIGQLTPAQITDVLVADLSASGLFSAVDREGAVQADIVIKPTLKNAWVTMGGISGDAWDFGLQIDAAKGGKTVLSKLYKRTWKTGALGMDTSDEAKDLQNVMDELRADLAKALTPAANP
jgi:hypothetical protein